MKKVKFTRKTSEEINNLPIEDGQLVYDVETGKTYMDYEDKRIPTGGGESNLDLSNYYTKEEIDEMFNSIVNGNEVSY